MLAQIRNLRNAGVMGINKRNADFTLRYNPRNLYPLVDDKAQTKKLAQAAGIAIPELFFTIEIEQQIRRLPALLQDYPEFVIKPAQGSGGDGIVIITRRHRDQYHKSSSLLMSEDEIRHHVSNILSGLYSLGGQPDKALIEARVQSDSVFDNISYLGIPDIRIIVFLGVPIMAMVRLPTRSSDGKANLHQGAIGAGIDIATGRTLNAVWNNAIINEHPDTGYEVTNVQLPHWEQILEISARCYELTGLGYQGVDIVLDRDKGPLVLELNARPGLNIQIANHCGLLHRLELVEQQINNLDTLPVRIEFAKQHFSVSR